MKIQAERLATEIENSIKSVADGPWCTESFAVLTDEDRCIQVQIVVTREREKFMSNIDCGVEA